MIFSGDYRITCFISSDIVKTYADGRNMVADSCRACDIGFITFNLVICAVSVGTPVVTVGSVVSEVGYIGIG